MIQKEKLLSDSSVQIYLTTYPSFILLDIRLNPYFFEYWVRTYLVTPTWLINWMQDI